MLNYIAFFRNEWSKIKFWHRTKLKQQKKTLMEILNSVYCIVHAKYHYGKPGYASVKEIAEGEI